MKQGRNIIVCWVLCLLVTGIGNEHISRASSDQPAGYRIGDITHFTGEVLVRSSGRWQRLQTVPWPVSSLDKVVTRRGRAELRFVDGGILRMDLDSNISIHKKEETTGFIFKKKRTMRQVNILVGKLWFEVKIKKGGPGLKFRTPTMTAAVRGTAGEFMVNIEGTTDHGCLTGETQTSGDFRRNRRPRPFSRNLVRQMADTLPSSNPAVEQAPFQQAAVKAVQRWEKINAGQDEISESSGPADRVRQCETAHVTASAAEATTGEVVEEASRFNDSEALEIAESHHREAQMIVQRTAETLETVSLLTQVSENVADEEQRQALDKVAAAQVAAAVTESALAETVAIVTMAQTAGDMETAEAAETRMREERITAEQSRMAAEEAVKAVEPIIEEQSSSSEVSETEEISENDEEAEAEDETEEASADEAKEAETGNEAEETSVNEVDTGESETGVNTIVNTTSANTTSVEVENTTVEETTSSSSTTSSSTTTTTTTTTTTSTTTSSEETTVSPAG